MKTKVKGITLERLKEFKQNGLSSTCTPKEFDFLFKFFAGRRKSCSLLDEVINKIDGKQ